MNDQGAQYGDTVWIAAPLAAAPHMMRVRERYLAGELDITLQSTEGSYLADEATVLVTDQRLWRESEIRRLKGELPYPLLRRLLDLVAKLRATGYPNLRRRKTLETTAQFSSETS